MAIIKKMRSWDTGKESSDEIQRSKWISYFQNLFGIGNDNTDHNNRTYPPEC